VWHIVVVGSPGVAQGSNQYARRRAVGAALAAAAGLLTQVAVPAGSPQTVSGLPAACSCGELWGGRCACLVGPPGWSHGRHPTVRQRRGAAQARGTRGDVWEILVGDLDPNVRRLAAANGYCPPDILGRFAYDADRKVRRAVAENPACPLPVLQLLAEDTDQTVRSRVAGHPMCSPELLRDLGRDREVMVRRAVAGHPNCPAEVLGQLAACRQAAVYECALAHPACPAEMVVRAAQDAEDLRRWAAAKNPSCPPIWLALLAGDPVQDVSSCAAHNPGCPPDMLRALAQRASSNHDDYLMCGVASNLSCPPDVLISLAAHPYYAVRRCVARNSSAPVSTLQEMLQDPDRHVVEAAVANPSLSAATLAMWQLVHGTR
jgi:hypothetical protein